jgi:hypothetical protein
MKRHSIELLLPRWTLSPLFYDDSTGTTEADFDSLNALIDRLVAEHGSAHAVAALDLGFRNSNALDNLGGDCARVTFHVGN